ncbi:cell division FtsA domain-containing protein [Heliophilum fasciatum]|uniref:Cell division protein FtsA n=1 Tax=Heliophilum fasciatum TaxID=35700 RepID=A0A4V2SX08_9FIRM|nr:cell division FtsA domain-containing protein [Heliophilum fasciatum]MCW2278157.1 cell division protein FtsA [Heliophilum fasciatum]TCP64226.1 cell division protein FtsA [Heliophilum fasciatum]
MDVTARDDQNGLIFALDIGTRSVVGIVARQAGDKLEVLHTAQEEHRQRAMLDGQIHDVNQVAEVVQNIKAKLESELGQPLKRASIAAAGRSLLTMRGRATRQSPVYREFSKDDVLAMELSAVQNAQQQLKGSEGESIRHYLCVGYSVVQYFLEGTPIGNLDGHRGLQGEVEIIGTFLPRMIVDSLMSVLNRIGLEMESLTLEPIAAIQVVIPPNMRQLNLALVDIGAGTSDIALTANGMIIAYAMAPIAGDEMTEQLCQKYLLGFDEGEKLKREIQALMPERNAIWQGEPLPECTLPVCDVIGFEQEVPFKDLLETMMPGVQQLSQQITERIVELNGKAPQAVILVGGGALTPMLADQVAEDLSLAKERVGVRGRESLKGLTGKLDQMMGPEFVTPVGIAASSIARQTLGYYEVMVNGEKVRMFNAHQGTVGDALLTAGVSLKNVHGLPGLAMTIEVNGQLRILPGTMGEPAVIKVNGVEQKLDTMVAPGDVIEYVDARPGKNGGGVVGDIFPTLAPMNLVVNGQPICLQPTVLLNGELAEARTPLIDGARLVYRPIATIADVLDLTGDLVSLQESTSIRYIFNGEEKIVTITEPEILLNDLPASLMNAIHDGDTLVVRMGEPIKVRVSDVVDESQWQSRPLEVTVNDTLWTFEGPKKVLLLNGKPTHGDEIIKNGDRLDVEAGRSVDLIMSELLMRIGFDPTPPPGMSRLEATVSGLPADYATPIPNRGIVEVKWR